MAWLGRIIGVVAGALGIGVVVNEVTNNNETSETVTSVFDISGLLMTLAVAGVITLIIYLVKRRK